MSGQHEQHTQGAHAELDELAGVIDRHMEGRSGSRFVRPLVSFVRLVQAPARLPVQGRAAIALLAQGTKRLHMSDRIVFSSPSECLVSATTTDAHLELIESRPQRPFRQHFGVTPSQSKRLRSAAT